MSLTISSWYNNVMPFMAGVRNESNVLISGFFKGAAFLVSEVVEMWQLSNP